MSILNQNKKTVVTPTGNPYSKEYFPLTEKTATEKPKYERMIFNLHPDLVADINEHINNLKREGKKEYDPIVGKYKKINLSLWARQVLEDALKKEGYVRPTRNQQEIPQLQKNEDQG